MSLAIPLYIFLFIYLAFLVLFIVFFIFNLIHLMHTGGTTLVSLVVTILVFAMTAFSLLFTYNLVAGTDWRQPIEINIANNFSNSY